MDNKDAGPIILLTLGVIAFAIGFFADLYLHHRHD